MNLHTNPVPSLDLPNSEEDGAQDNVYIPYDTKFTPSIMFVNFNTSITSHL